MGELESARLDHDAAGAAASIRATIVGNGFEDEFLRSRGQHSNSSAKGLGEGKYLCQLTTSAYVRTVLFL